jgi:phage tail-like protein
MANSQATPAKNTLSRYSTIATDPLRNFRFIVDFSATGDGEPIGTGDNSLSAMRGGFTSVSGLNISTQSINYREGGMNTTLHQMPGMTTFSPITLTRGTILGNDQAINWMRTLFAAASGEGIPVGDKTTFRCNLTIYVLDHPAVGAPNLDGDLISEKAYKMKFKVYNAFITNLSYSDLNAQGNEIVMETMTLVHEGLTASLAAAGGSVV